MGFYGNITNTSNTTFVFDKIYPNRLAMDANANNDGIFIGRYVLVEYQNTAAYPVVYIKGSKFYSSPNCEVATQIKFLTGTRADDTDIDKDGYFDGVYENEIVQNYVNLKQNGNNITFDKIEYYKCTGGVGGFAIFEKTTPANQSDYIKNFGIDELHYSNEKSFKGYDSTVWTKASVESEGRLITKYVQIADLNSVVPTFDIAADAPTMTPITPHFDADSTNVYYKLHMQAPYGFRIKEGVEGKSDEATTWYETTYNKETNTTTTTETQKPYADIYFNEAGFNPTKVSKVGGDNFIKLAPTGKSNAQYSHGNGTNDIQEFSMHLPAIGDMMSDAWDIIHGPNRDDAQTDENGSLQGRLDSFKAMEKDAIPVKRNPDGTFVGTRINGNSNKTVGTNKILEENLSTSFDQDDAWIRTEIDTKGLDNTNKLSGISIHHTWHKQSDTTSTTNKNNDNVSSSKVSDKIDLYTPIVDKAGHIVGKNTETVTLPYGYKTITTNGRGDGTEINTFDKVAAKTQNIVAENTQDELAINSGNEWIRIDTDATNDILTISHDIHKTSTSTSDQSLSSEETVTTFDVPTYSFDDAGHYVSHDTKTITVPYGYGKITCDSGNTSATATFDTLEIKADDAWIATEALEDKVSITHTGPVTGTPVTVADVEPEFGETFSITDWHYDAKGHKYDSTSHNVKIPDGSYTPANSATPHTDIITSLGFTSRTGAITSTKANTNTLTLYNYSANTNSHSKLIDIVDTDTINNAFKKIQNHINSLNLNVDETINNTQIITSITQKNGQISLSRAAAGTLQLGTPSTDGTIPENSSLNNAFNITNTRFKTNEDALAREVQDRKDAITKEINDRNTAISSAISAIVDKDDDGTINKLAEVIEWINNNPSTATQMQKAIQNNTKAISDEAALARSEEGKIATALTTETGRATAAEQANAAAIGNEKTRAENIEAGLQEQIETLQAWKATATEDIASLNNTISQLLNTINDLTTRIENLENPPQESDEGGETI